MQLDKLLHRRFMAQVREEGSTREAGRKVFLSWKAMYAANLAGYIRNAVKMRERGITMPKGAYRIDWCNAAMLILDSAPEDIASDFLLADHATKDDFVKAVLADGGLENLNGFYVQVPEV